VLRPLASIFRPEDYPDLLVGLDSADDAAIWRLNEHQALVATTDFFTPVVDDPYDYGAIAAANSLSDIYAMGGKPFLALNIAALPPHLPTEVSTAIVRGAAEKAKEAGVVIAGGHTIQDKEPKFGLVVLGIVDPDAMLTKGGLQPGDQLFLSKPLGFGVATTAHKRELLTPEELEEVTGWMKQLNRDASELAIKFGLHGGTDVTGFSLLGHASEMVEASGCGITFYWHALPFIRSALKYAQAGTFPGGAFDNRGYFEHYVSFDPAISEIERMLLFDPQTSGGLLLAVPTEKAVAFAKAAQLAKIALWQVGEVTAEKGIKVAV
jgi:selenide,water dikinase